MFEPLYICELKHPTAASRQARLCRMLVLDIEHYGEKAWLLKTRSGSVWFPVSQLYRDPTEVARRGEVFWAPRWLCEKKFDELG